MSRTRDNRPTRTRAGPRWRALLGGMCLSLVATLSPAPKVVADDIDIYQQAGTADTQPPLVVLNLDLNLDPTEIVCSNVLADPSTLVGEPACELLQQVAVLPVLEQALGLEIGELLDTLLGNNPVTGGLVGLVSGLTGATLGSLADSLRGITGDEGSGTSVALDQLDVVRLLLYRVLHQLVGVRVAVLASHANTCEAADFDDPRADTDNCSNGAVVLLRATELLESNLDRTVDNLLNRVGQIDTQRRNRIEDYTNGNKVTMCHKPPKDPDDTETVNVDISINVNAVDTHLAHGDYIGPCSDPPALAPHPFQGKEVYFELLRYLTGGSVYNAGLNHDDSLPLLADPAATNASGASYNSPLDTATCGDIRVINVLLTDPDDQDESDADILAFPGMAGADGPGDGGFTFAEMTRHLADQGFDHGGGNYRLHSYYLINGIEGGGPTQLLSNLVGTTMDLPIGLNPLATPFASRDSFLPVSNDSASLGGPQPVFSRARPGEAQPALFTGLFQPDPDRAPAWNGNLKKLAVTDGASPIVVDALGQPAVGPNGQIADGALTFWTEPSDLDTGVTGTVNGRDGGHVTRGGAGMYLGPPTTPPSPTNPPGNAGSGSGGPRIFYQTAGNGLSLAPLNLDTTTVEEAQPALAADDKLHAAELVAWARGYETSPAELGEAGYGGLLGFLDSLVQGLTSLVKNLVRDVLRSLFCNPILGLLGVILGYSCDVPAAVEPPPQDWQMGDVLHSHPLAIDYGRGSAGGDDIGTNIRIFTGTNRGFLHQFRNDANGSTSFAGQEVWRLAPRAVMAHFKRWQSGSPTAASRPYGLDGAPVALIQDNDGVVKRSQGDHVWLYFGLRRGGKAYYGLDATNPDAPPQGLWSIEKGAPGSNFAELGLTFSTPQPGYVRLADSNGDTSSRPVLVFAGGYDGGYTSAGNALGKDAARGSLAGTDGQSDSALIGQDDDEGNALFVVDAETGELIWKARHGSRGHSSSADADVWQHPAMDDSIPSDVTALDTDGDGHLDRLYVGDTGGRVWRADIGAPDAADWRAEPIASLGRHAGNTGLAGDRRFFHPPDVVRVSAGAQSFYAVVIGSGNRADPLNRATNNRLFVIKDGEALPDNPDSVTLSDLANFSGNCSGGACDSLLDPAFSPAGWQMALGSTGEKILSSPTTIAGKVLVTSYVPPAAGGNACTPQTGTGRLYAVDIRNAAPALPAFDSDGDSAAAGGSLAMARSTPLRSAGIPAEVQYLRPETFLASDFGILDINHRLIWRTYWRERVGDQ
ncbi:MAG: PilC/PilY family type IV pilus protein [Salinisphaeraceae bacterium]